MGIGCNNLLNLWYLCKSEVWFRGEHCCGSACFMSSKRIKMSESIKNTIPGNIYVSDSARNRVSEILAEKEAGNDSGSNYFLRVSVVSGGCSGLSYKLDFDKDHRPMDQIFENNGVKVVTDMKSLLYLLDTTLEFSDGLSGKGFYFNNPNASRTCACGESFSV